MEPSSSGGSDINRVHEVPILNRVVENDFPGARNIPNAQQPPVENTVPKHLLGSLTDYHGEIPKMGGFGIVVKVFSPFLGTAALKVLKNMCVTVRDRELWQREFENIYRLNHHPNIVGLYGYVYDELPNTSDDLPVGILMEYMLGGSLFDYVANHGYVITKEIQNTWAKQIALGMNFIHGQGLMHRDLKPDNILLSQNRYIAKIADFGLSKRISSADANTINIGSPVYTAPEVYMDAGKYSFEADVWSYGMLLYFIYYLGNPYDPEILKKIAPLIRVNVWKGSEEHPNMPMRPILIGFPIDILIALCWETEPKDRCTISDVVDQLHSPTGVDMFPSLNV